MKAALASLLLLVASVALARDCMPVDPAVAAKLEQACVAMVSPEVQAQFQALTEREGASAQLDHSALKAALEQAAAKVDPASMLLAVSVRYCRASADPEAEDVCAPALTLLNTGLQSYDPDHETAEMLAGRQSYLRNTARRIPQAQPPAYAELRCLAVSATVSPALPGS
jgi:hypothetical protein